MGHDKSASILAGIYWFISVVIVSSVVGGSFASQVLATEIINGEVTAKDVRTGHYLRSYSCNCKTRCSGTGNNRSCNTTCDTCYENRYTKTWSCDTTVGSHTIESLDRGSKSVWLTPDPERYKVIKVGEPASAGKFYTNYVQAVPGSLFAKNITGNGFPGLLPAYPQVYDIYRVNRFLTPGLGVANAAEWNEKLSLSMNKLGRQKEVNLIVVAAKTNDRAYAEALNHHWKGANKNDVIVVLGATQWPKLDFVEVLSWSKSELFKVKLRDELFALGEVTPDAVVAVTSKHIREGFVRRQMSEFEYLKDEIHSPTWVVVTTVILQILSSIILVIWFKYEQNSNRRSSISIRTGSSRYWTGR